MTTIMVDDDDRGTQVAVRLPPPAEFKPTPIRERLDEPIGADADCIIWEGQPYLLYADCDYAEDWSGEFIRELHPFVLIGKPKVSEMDWRKLLKGLHRAG